MGNALMEMQELSKDEYFALGLKADKEGDLQNALANYRNALKLDPSFFLAWLNTGAVYARANKSENAIQCYEKALNIQREPKALYNLASEQFKRSDFETAQDLLDECLDQSPEFIPALMLQAYNYGKLDRNEDATEILDRVLELKPDHVPALTALVLLHYHADQYHLCEEYLDRVRELDSTNPMLSKLHAKILLMRDDLEGSIELLKELASSDSRLQGFNESLSKIPKESSDLMEAKINDILNLEEKSSADYLNLSFLQLFQGNIADALDNLAEASKDR